MEKKRTVNGTAFEKYTVKAKRKEDPHRNKAFQMIIEVEKNKISNINGASTYADCFGRFDSSFEMRALYSGLHLASLFRMCFIRNLYLLACLYLP